MPFGGTQFAIARIMHGEMGRLGLYGLAAAACVGFWALDQVAESYSPADDDKAPQVSAVLTHVRESTGDTQGAASAVQAARETPPRQRPAINGSLGEGSDALDAKELRRGRSTKRDAPRENATAPEPAAAPPAEAPSFRWSPNREEPIPRATPREAPPLTSEIVSRGWNDPDSQAQRGQRATENGGPAPLWLEALANQFGIRARFIPLHRPSNTVSRYVDPCDKRDYRCQEFHDNFFREDVETSPIGMTNSIGAGVAGGIVRAAGVDREIRAPLMWTVKPRFVGLEAAF